jgi:hypothetical protein
MGRSSSRSLSREKLARCGWASLPGRPHPPSRIATPTENSKFAFLVSASSNRNDVIGCEVATRMSWQSRSATKPGCRRLLGSASACARCLRWHSSNTPLDCRRCCSGRRSCACSATTQESRSRSGCGSTAVDGDRLRPRRRSRRRVLVRMRSERSASPTLRRIWAGQPCVDECPRDRSEEEKSGSGVSAYETAPRRAYVGAGRQPLRLMSRALGGPSALTERERQAARQFHCCAQRRACPRVLTQSGGRAVRLWRQGGDQHRRSRPDHGQDPQAALAAGGSSTNDGCRTTSRQLGLGRVKADVPGAAVAD